jgi:hypothetical protein
MAKLTDTPAPIEVTMRIKRTSGQGFDVLASRTDTIALVKQRLGELTGRNTESMLLIYSGKEMEAGKTIKDYCAQDITMAIFLRFLQTAEA